VIVYNSTLELEGTFDLSEISRLQVPPVSIEWGKACLQLGITDTRGIQNEIALEWSGQNCSAEPGLIIDDIALSGITIKVPVTPDDRIQPFSMKMELRGSEWFHIVPSGKTTKIRLTSPWTTPSFTGAFLPDKREISPSGFDAEWEVFHLNRSFPQVWIDQTYSLDESSFGLSLLFPTDEYQKSTRSVKYAILFIALTFLIFVLIEVINHRKVHPVQYLLVSFGLLIFYTLLISLSEHLGFNLAYLVSGISVVGLITIYTYSIFKKVSLTVLMGSSLTALYIFLFVILQLQDFALLIGSIGLFVILGLVMLLTRKISWYRTSDQ
jgi:inner membrane protein